MKLGTCLKDICMKRPTKCGHDLMCHGEAIQNPMNILNPIMVKHTLDGYETWYPLEDIYTRRPTKCGHVMMCHGEEIQNPKNTVNTSMVKYSYKT